MKKKNLQKWSLTFVLLLLLAGCSSYTVAEEETVPEEKSVRQHDEGVEVKLKEAVYNKELEKYKITFSTNIEEGIKARAALFTSDDVYLGENSLVLPDDSTEQYTQIEISVSARDLEKYEVNGIYLELRYGTDTNPQIYGDYDAEDLIKRYEFSEYVTIIIHSHDSNLDYDVAVESNEILLKKAAHEKKEIVETQQINDNSYSPDFIDYNTKYYTQFKNQMDLIASNFEILAMDGFENQDIVDDLITWTSEFNALLDVYETDSVPLNEMDQELHDHTIQMIRKQRLANENIINGLKEYDETYFFNAGEHLESVIDMYLTGYELLED